jgi:hypothetical protein
MDYRGRHRITGHMVRRPKTRFRTEMIAKILWLILIAIMCNVIVFGAAYLEWVPLR